MQSEVYTGEDQLICMCLGLSFQQLGHDHYNDISLAKGPDNNAAVLCEVIHRYWQLFSDWNPKIKHSWCHMKLVPEQLYLNATPIHR